MAAYFAQGNSWRFSGSLFGVEDGNSYLAKMLSGATGELLFKTPYTTVNQNGFIAFLPYILLGMLTSDPGQHEQLVVLLQLFRWSGIILLSFSSYYFISNFIESHFYRKVVLIISVLGGGLGWVSLFWNKIPLELYSPETFGFLSVMGIPHLLFSKALLITGLSVFISREHFLKNACIVGVLFFLVGFFQPLTIVVGWFVITASFCAQLIHTAFKQKKDFQVFLKKEIPFMLIIGLLSSPWVLYNIISFQSDSFLKGWYQQNIILSPDPGAYLLSLGILIIAAVWGVSILYKKNPGLFFFSAGWLIVFPLMVYFPMVVQRRMAEGIWNILVILAVLPLMDRPIQKKIILGLTTILFISSIVFYAGAFSAAINPQQPVFIPQTEVEAFDLLKKKVISWDVVLAPYQVSNALPSWLPVRVVAGHGPESINLIQVTKDIDGFLKSSDINVAAQFIQQYHPKFVLLDARENSMDNKVNFSKVFQDRDFIIYQYTGK